MDSLCVGDTQNKKKEKKIVSDLILFFDTFRQRAAFYTLWGECVPFSREEEIVFVVVTNVVLNKNRRFDERDRERGA